MITRTTGKLDAEMVVVLERVRIFGTSYGERSPAIGSTDTDHSNTSLLALLTLIMTAEQAWTHASAKHVGELDVARMPRWPNWEYVRCHRLTSTGDVKL